MIAIVDMGGANLASVKNALERLGMQVEVTDDPQKITSASHVILPGVGAAGRAMARLEERNLIPLIRGLKQPVLGICLGMQILFENSEEDGGVRCLGVLPGTVEKMQAQDGLPIPHMGWNRVHQRKEAARLLNGIPDGSHFYYVHSYRAPLGEHVMAVSEYGEPVPAVIEAGAAGGPRNFFGIQFHPEKSGEAGEKLLRNFLEVKV